MNEHHNIPPDESESHAALDSSEMVPTTDQIADYRLEERIGGGRFGEIFRASHNRLRRTVAIRILATEAVADPTTTQQFLREMRTVALVEHTNLVRCFDAGQQDQLVYVVSELIDGQDLATTLQQNGNVSVEDTCELLSQAAHGFAHVHDNGLHHGHVKPSNLILTKDGVIKVTDLGLSLLARNSPQLNTTVALQDSDKRIRDDIVGLGLTACCLLTADSSFHNDYQTSPYAAIMRLKRNCPKLSSDFVQLIQKLLDAHSASGFSTMGQVIDALEPYTMFADIQKLISGPALKASEDAPGLSAELQTENEPAVQEIEELDLDQIVEDDDDQEYDVQLLDHTLIPHSVNQFADDPDGLEIDYDDLVAQALAEIEESDEDLEIDPEVETETEFDFESKSPDHRPHETRNTATAPSARTPVARPRTNRLAQAAPVAQTLENPSGGWKIAVGVLATLLLVCGGGPSIIYYLWNKEPASNEVVLPERTEIEVGDKGRTVADLPDEAVVQIGDAEPAKQQIANGQPLLRYNFTRNRIYMYRIRIEADTGSYLETLSGMPMYTVTHVDDDQIQVRFIGSLHKSQRSKPGHRGPTVFPRFGFDSTQFGGTDPYNVWRNQLTIDRRGAVLNTDIDSQLPFLLGELSMLVIEPLPEKAQDEWTVKKRKTITLVSSDDRIPGVPMRFGGRRPFGGLGIGNEPKREVMPASETVNYKIKQWHGDQVVIEKKYELSTDLMLNGKPRMELTGTGEFTFDAALGIPIAMEFELKKVVREQNAAQSTPIKLSYKLLSELERRQLIEDGKRSIAEAKKKRLAAEAKKRKEVDAEAKKRREVAAEAKKKRELAAKNRKQKNPIHLLPQPARPRNDVSIESLIADLESGKTISIMIALNKLKQRPAEPNPKLAKAIESAVSNDNKPIQYLAVRALETWATPENVPFLIEKMNSDQTVFLIRRSCMLALAKLKNPAAVDSIAKQLDSRHMRNYAVKALQQLGPLAEKAVLEKLQSKDWQVRLAICQILEESGTEESLLPLQTIQQTDANGIVKFRAGRALELIQTRLAKDNKKQ